MKILSRGAQKISIILLLIGILICLGLGYLFNELRKIDPFQPITDIAQYSKIRSQFWKQREYLLQHFPNAIPPEATDARIYYLSTLVGGNTFQLRLKLPPSEIEELLAQYREMAIDEIDLERDGFEDTRDQATQARNIPTTHFYTSDSSDLNFPKTYEMIVLYAEASGYDENIWNHGASYGVAINKSASEIVYWVEDW